MHNHVHNAFEIRGGPPAEGTVQILLHVSKSLILACSLDEDYGGTLN